MEILYNSDLAVISFVSEADIVIKSVLLLLAFASFVSWAIIFEKYFRFKTLNFRAKRFERSFWSGKEISVLYNQAKKENHHPLSQVFISAMEEWQLQPKTSDHDAKDRLKDRVFQAMTVTKNKNTNKIQSNLSFLATTSSAAPFIGLFGTVWGIMNSFNAIANTQNTSLSVVAPGISEALFATAVGLFVAIPALIYYNYFANKLKSYTARIDNFSLEIINLLSRELEK